MLLLSFAYLLQGAGLGLSAAASPGPFQTYLINQTLIGGWRRSVPLAIVPLISDPIIILMVILVLEQLPSQFLDWISLAGGFFILYLATSFWRQLRLSPETLPEPQRGSGGVMRKGVLMNLFSPGPYTYWILVNGPILLAAMRQSPFQGLAFLIGFYTVIIMGFLAIVMIFHQARKLGPRLVRVMTLISVLILLVFAGLLIFQGINALVI